MNAGVYGIMFFGIKASEKEKEVEIWCGKLEKWFVIVLCYLRFIQFSFSSFMCCFCSFSVDCGSLDYEITM